MCRTSHPSTARPAPPPAACRPAAAPARGTSSPTPSPPGTCTMLSYFTTYSVTVTQFAACPVSYLQLKPDLGHVEGLGHESGDRPRHGPRSRHLARAQPRPRRAHRRHRDSRGALVPALYSGHVTSEIFFANLKILQFQNIFRLPNTISIDEIFVPLDSEG